LTDINEGNASAEEINREENKVGSGGESAVMPFESDGQHSTKLAEMESEGSPEIKWCPARCLDWIMLLCRTS